MIIKFLSDAQVLLVDTNKQQNYADHLLLELSDRRGAVSILTSEAPPLEFSFQEIHDRLGFQSCFEQSSAV